MEPRAIYIIGAPISAGESIMKGGAIRSVLLATLLLGSISLICFPGPCAATPITESVLYIHKDGTLSTVEPESSGTQNPLAGPLTVGASIEFDSVHPFVDDLDIEGAGSGGEKGISIHLVNTVDTGTGLVLFAELLAVDGAGTERAIAAGEFEQDELDGGDLLLFFGSDTVQEGSYLRLRLSLTEGTGTLLTPASFSFLYSLGSDHSSITLMADPIPAGSMELSLLQDGRIVDTVLPNGPEEARTVDLSVKVKDIFGAYDVHHGNVTIADSEGTMLFDSGNLDADPDGGEEWAYINRSFTVPQNTPEGEYTVTARVASNTGQEVSATEMISIASGLYVSLIDGSERKVDAGDVATFEMKVVNGGSRDDRVSFAMSSSKGWQVQAPPDMDMAGGEETTVTFRVTVPVEAKVGDRDTPTMTATSRNAGEDYEVIGAVSVAKAATFSLEVDGDTDIAVYLGSMASFSLRLRNLENITRTYDLSVEDPPDEVDFIYDGPGVSLSGSVYTVTVAPGERIPIDLNVTVSSADPGGLLYISAFARAKGSTDRRYAYLTLLAVDGQRKLVSADGEAVQKATSRTGSTYPVTYRPVPFQLALYNPTLSREDLTIDVQGPEGWGTDSEIKGSMELDPGASAIYNLTIAPATGTLYSSGGGWEVEVTASMPGVQDSSVTLSVTIPLIVDIRATGEGSTVEGKAGEDLMANITISNMGNRAETVTLRTETSDDLTALLSSESIELAPGAKEKVGLTVSTPKTEKDTNYKVTVVAKDSSGRETKVETDLYARGV